MSPWSRRLPAARGLASSPWCRSSSRRSWPRRLPVVPRSHPRSSADASRPAAGARCVGRGGEPLSQIAVEQAARKRAAVPTQAPGSAFFAVMAGLWGSFVTLLAVSPETLDGAYDWLRELPVVWEILMWILTLPWTVAYLAYATS